MDMLWNFSKIEGSNNPVNLWWLSLDGIFNVDGLDTLGNTIVAVRCPNNWKSEAEERFFESYNKISKIEGLIEVLDNLVNLKDFYILNGNKISISDEERIVRELKQRRVESDNWITT